jgi:murein DD-endopeptidase MepM/ murein hydrolase activator NlpD
MVFQMRMIYAALLVVMVVVSPAMIMAEVEGPEVWFSSTELRPGDFIQMKVKAPDDALVGVSFRKSTRELWKTAQNEFIGFLPVSYYNPPGEYQVTILVKTAAYNWTKSFPIRLSERKFPESRVYVPKTTRKKILTSSNTNSDAKKTAQTRLEAVQTETLPLWEGPFIWPVKGRISTGFGRIRYVNDIDNGRHSGLDIISPSGTPVLAVNRGRVVFADNLYVTGLTVILHHGLNLFTSYCHLSAITVKEGDLIEKGSVLGKVGSTGLSTGPHLHLTFKIDEVSVDPYLFLERSLEWDFPRPEAH